MNLWRALILLWAGVCGAAGVALAAVGAHMTIVDANMLQKAWLMLVLHALLLVALVGLSGSASPLRGYAKAWLILATTVGFGMLMFSGDVGYRALTGSRFMVDLAPMGGGLLMGGWLGVAGIAGFSGWRGRQMKDVPASKRDVH